jgi:hypothetical protein
MNNFNEVSLNLLGAGKAVEQFDYQLKKAIENCTDPNTDSDVNRVITLKVTIKPSPDRKDASLFFQTSAKLAPDSAGGEHLFLSKGKAYVQDMEQLTFDELEEQRISLLTGE